MRNLLEAAREAGWSERIAAALLSDASRFGQVAWASPEDEGARENVRNVRDLRRMLLSQAMSAGDAQELDRKGIIAAMEYRLRWVGAEMGVEPGQLDIQKKMEFAKTRLSAQGGIWGIAGDTGADDIGTFLSGAGLFQMDAAARGKTWEDLGAAAGRQASGAGFLDPEAVESALEGKARGIIGRFGLGELRVGGLPSEEQALEILERLERALGDLAGHLGIEERSIGLSGAGSKGLTIHLENPTEWNGYATWLPGDRPALCLRAGDGFFALAHEWFHAFDKALGAAVSQGGVYEAEMLSVLADADPKLEEKSGSPEVVRAARAALDAIRIGDGEATIEALRAQGKGRAIERCLEMYDKSEMTKKLAEGKDPEQAREAFAELYAGMLDGEQGKADLEAWRRSWLRSEHHEGTIGIVILAEAKVRRESLKIPERKSLLQAFAEEADRAHDEAGSSLKKGYWASPEEMLARGFEGNLFLDLPKERRDDLTDCDDGSLCWPAGIERGRAGEAYRSLVRIGMEFLSGAAPDSAGPKGALGLGDARRESELEPAPEAAIAGAEALGARLDGFRKRKAQGASKAIRGGPSGGAKG